MIVAIVPERAAATGQMDVFAPLMADLATINDRYDDDTLAAILDYLRSCNDAIERSTARLRGRPRADPSEGFVQGPPARNPRMHPNPRMGQDVEPSRIWRVLRSLWKSRA